MHHPAALRGISAAFLSFLATTGPMKAAIPIAGPIVNPTTGHRYYLLSPDTAPLSQLAAVKLGGSLVTINDEFEQVWVFDTFGNFGGVTRNLWIGLLDEAQEGNFVWSDGSKATYRNWAVNAPDSFGDEDSVYILHSLSSQAGKWNDLNGNLTTWEEHPLCGVVEVGPPSVEIVPAVAVRWTAREGVRYQVQTASEATAHMWQSFGGPVIGTGQSNLVFDVVVGNEQRFYRVIELPQ